jgi:hypothetical protein
MFHNGMIMTCHKTKKDAPAQDSQQVFIGDPPEYKGGADAAKQFDVETHKSNSDAYDEVDKDHNVIKNRDHRDKAKHGRDLFMILQYPLNDMTPPFITVANSGVTSARNWLYHEMEARHALITKRKRSVTTEHSNGSQYAGAEEDDESWQEGGDRAKRRQNHKDRQPTESSNSRN